MTSNLNTIKKIQISGRLHPDLLNLKAIRPIFNKCPRVRLADKIQTTQLNLNFR